MLIFDRTQRTWATLSAVVCVVAGTAYVCYSTWSPNGPSGGSVPGLIFGLIAAGMMVFAGLLSVRRRFPIARWGSGQFWLRAHLWIGGLTVPFALFHAGFGLGGRLEILLWILFFTVIASGFWGLALQQVLPRMMLEQIPRETFVEQIPHLCRRFTIDSDRLLAELCGPLEISLTAVELKHYESHLRRHFDEDRSKNRAQYPKTSSDAEHFQIFLSKVYVGNATPATSTAPPALTSPGPAVPVASAAPPAVPALQSVARVTPAPDADVPATPARAAKPDPQAILAAAKARKAALAAAPAVTAPEANPDTVDPHSETPTTSSANPPAAAKPKPDPQALLAAARAKRAALAAGNPAAEPPPAASPITERLAPAELAGSPTPDAPLSPAPSATPPTTATPEPVADSPPVAKPKPDPQALLAAARARKAALAAETPTPAPDSVNPILVTTDQPAVTNPAGGKPSPQAMLAEIKAKREAAARATAANSAKPPPSDAPAVADSPAKPNPLVQLRAVRDAAASQAGTPEAVLTAAAQVAPPTPAQLAEMKLFYVKLIRPHLPEQQDTREWMEAIRRSTMACRIRQDNQHPQFIQIFDHLHEMCEQRRQFAFVLRYHRWLHGWLLVHIPATVALYLVLVVHAVVALRVIPFGN